MDGLDQSHSSRQVAAWLMKKTDQKISYQGIIKIWKRHCGKGTTKPSKGIKQIAKNAERLLQKNKQFLNVFLV